VSLELLTIEEVMDLLRVSRDTVYRLAASGKLPGRKIGRAWRFPKDEIESYVRQRELGSAVAKDSPVHNVPSSGAK